MTRDQHSEAITFPVAGLRGDGLSIPHPASMIACADIAA